MNRGEEKTLASEMDGSAASSNVATGYSPCPGKCGQSHRKWRSLKMQKTEKGAYEALREKKTREALGNPRLLASVSSSARRRYTTPGCCEEITQIYVELCTVHPVHRQCSVNAFTHSPSSRVMDIGPGHRTRWATTAQCFLLWPL